MDYRAQFEQWVPVSLESVFLFFSNPGNLPRIMPEWMQVRLERVKIVLPPGIAPTSSTVTDENPIAGTGSELEASYRALPGIPFRIHAVASITEFEMNHYFEDIQQKGPFKRWHHRHEFASEARGGVNGTVIRDFIDYEVGFGVIGSAVQRWFIAPQMQRTFEHRQQVVMKLLR